MSTCLSRFIRTVLLGLALFPLVATSFVQGQKGHYAPRLHDAAKPTSGGSLHHPVAAAVPVRDFDAHIYLFALGTGGYGYPARSLLNGPGVNIDSNGNGYILSDVNGLFDLTGLYENACTTDLKDGSPVFDVPVYLLATDGATVAGPNPLNVTAAAMPVLCGQLPGVQNVAINELTTVAAAYALASYATVSLDAFSTDNTLADAGFVAFSFANLLVDSTTGDFTSLAFSSYPAAIQQIDTVADILAACVDSDINTSTTCLQIAAATTPPGGTAPADTLQAALDIALYPNNNVQTLFSFASANSPYQPILPSAPASWTFTPLPNNPVITGISPQPAQPGAQVTITGTGFGPSFNQFSSYVVFGGVQAGSGTMPITAWSDTAIVLTVPLDAATGSVQIYTPNGVSPPFLVEVNQPGQASVPQIESLSFQQGPETMGVIIKALADAKFGDDPGSTPGNQVTISTISPVPLVMPVVPGGWTSTAITVQVPVGALSSYQRVSGQITVTVRGQNSISVPFTVLGDLIPCPPGQSTPSNPPQ